MTPVADPTLKLEREIVGLGRRRRVAAAPSVGGLSIDAAVDAAVADSGAGAAALAAAEPPHSGLVIGCDEVGRGALAGPVAVGLCVIDVRVTKSVPKGLRDSKMLAEPKREELAPIARAWSLAHAVGYASALEIDRIGISACLGLAGARALDDLVAAGVDVSSATIILDGQWDWLTPAVSRPLTIRTRIKADRDCASVAAASVISKVARDRLMIEHDSSFPHYGWVRNKGYASEEHRDAILAHGPSELHRHTWLSKMMAAPAEEPAIALDGLGLLDGPEPLETALRATADDSAA